MGVRINFEDRFKAANQLKEDIKKLVYGDVDVEIEDGNVIIEVHYLNIHYYHKVLLYRLLNRDKIEIIGNFLYDYEKEIQSYFIKK